MPSHDLCYFNRGASNLLTIVHRLHYTSTSLAHNNSNFTVPSVRANSTHGPNMGHASSKMSPVQTSRFLNLPAELGLQVYEHLFGEIPSELPLAALSRIPNLLTCKNIALVC